MQSIGPVCADAGETDAEHRHRRKREVRGRATDAQTASRSAYNAGGLDCRQGYLRRRTLAGCSFRSTIKGRLAAPFVTRSGLRYAKVEHRPRRVRTLASDPRFLDA